MEGRRMEGEVDRSMGGVATWMDDSVRATEQARVLHEALMRRGVPTGALYASPFQALRWLALHEAWSPARRDAGVATAYDRATAELAVSLNSESWALVSLGCGGGQKEERFLSRVARRPESSLVVDVSPSLALTSHERVSRWCRAHAGVIDLELKAGPSPWCEALLGGSEAGGRLRRVVFLLGMLPNMDMGHASRVLRAWTEPGDWVVLSANLASQGECEGGLRTVLPQYDNSETRSWLSGFMEWQGIRASSFTWRYGVERVASSAGAMARITVDAELLEMARVGVPGHAAVEWAAGETVRVFQSLRMTTSAAERFAADSGLDVMKAATDDNGQEGVWVLRRR